MIVSICPACKSIVVSPSYLEGQAIHCPNCGKRMTVQPHESREGIKEALRELRMQAKELPASRSSSNWLVTGEDLPTYPSRWGECYPTRGRFQPACLPPHLRHDETDLMLEEPAFKKGDGCQEVVADGAEKVDVVVVILASADAADTIARLRK